MDSHELDDAIHTGDEVICYFDDENVFETVPGGRRVLNTIGNHDCWKGHLVWAQTNKPYDAEKGDTYVRFFIGPDAQSPTVKGWEVTQPAGVDDPQSAVINLVHKLEQNNEKVNINDLAKSFQDVAVNMIIDRVKKTVKNTIK